MHTLIAFIMPFFSAFFHPITGGDLEWTQESDTTPVRMVINGAAICTVDLTASEAFVVADVMIDVIDNGALGKSVPLVNGGAITALDAGDGNIRFHTRKLPGCTVTLLGEIGEPEKVIDIFLDAAT